MKHQTIAAIMVAVPLLITNFCWPSNNSDKQQIQQTQTFTSHIESARNLYSHDHFDKAHQHLKQAFELRFDAPERARDLIQELFMLGNKFFALGQGKKAADVFKKILAINDRYSAVHHNLAFTLAERLGKHYEAIKHYRHSLQLRPDNPEVHFCHGLSCLATGDLQRGWQEYRYRWQRPGRAPRSLENNLDKLWSGQNLS